uniref:tRNA-intron lyase n=1 Tax=Trichobilharzia regenti TaxID=157069 RepID=A0AA85J5N8_TRIRE|nr:unnamed protein product [Trichobilharzia regenti]
MEVLLGRPKLNKSRQEKTSSSSLPILPKASLPFPIILKEDLQQSKHDDSSVHLFKQYRFQAVLVDSAKTLVTNTEQIKILQKRGCYGTGKRQESDIMHKIKMSTTRDYDTDDDDDDDDRNDENGNTSDTDSPLDSNFFSTGSKTNETILKKADVTQLVLSDVETLFLFHGLGCLDVYLPTDASLQSDASTETQPLKPLSLVLLWLHMCTGSIDLPCLQIQTARDQIEKYSEREINLLRRYAVYIYYRSKGWIVRPGACVGGADYLLYAESPDLRHAAFCVLVDSSDSTATTDKEQLNCASVAAHVRVAHAIGKKVILCRVCLPPIEDFTENPWEAVLKTMIKETLIDYWKPNAK